MYIVDQEKTLKHFFLVPYSTILGLCVGAVLLGLIMIAITWYCYRRRIRNSKRLGPEQPLAFQTHRRPTAVKSPAGNASGIQYLKKSPSPTGPSKTPPGVGIIILFIKIFRTST